MTAKELAEKHVKVTSTGQGTADVFLDDVHVRVFGGGASAITSGNHYKAQLVAAIQLIIEEWDARGTAVAPIQTEPMEIEVKTGPVEAEKKTWY